jgi:hypothetical protein
MELVSLKEVSLESKLKLLRALGYDSDGEFVVDKMKNRVLDRYINLPIRLDNMLVLPGSVVILDNNALSIAMYMEEYGDDIFG